MATQIKFTCGSTKGVITFDGSQASAPILLDGGSTGFQTADARHRTEEAVRLVLSKAFDEEIDMDDVTYSEVEG